MDYPIHALGNPETMNILSNAFVNTDHVLVLIQMNGGNDGLNTVIPTDQYTNLTKARSNIMIPISKVFGAGTMLRERVFTRR